MKSLVLSGKSVDDAFHQNLITTPHFISSISNPFR
ncbi:unnamed protein product [Rhodiola kirilowii]